MTIATWRTNISLAVAVVVVACLASHGSTHAQDRTKMVPAPPPAAPAQPAPAQPGTQTGQQGPAWTVQCANPGAGLQCKALQTILMAETRQLLLAVSVNKSAEGKNGAMLLHLPHGLFNPAGVTMAVDDAPAETLQIQTCDANGCYAGTPITPDKLAAMTKGTKLNVTFEDLKRQKITVPLPLKGFEDAYKKL
jgi:invasion protein IalB